MCNCQSTLASKWEWQTQIVPTFQNEQDNKNNNLAYILIKRFGFGFQFESTHHHELYGRYISRHFIIYYLSSLTRIFTKYHQSRQAERGNIKAHYKRTHSHHLSCSFYFLYLFCAQMSFYFYNLTEKKRQKGAKDSSYKMMDIITPMPVVRYRF